VLGETARGGLVFNGDVLGLADDPLPIAAHEGRPLRLHRARFFDAQCSNELCRLEIRHRSTGELLDLRQQLLLDTAGRLAPLAETELANIVGVSTLATTLDGRYVLVEQTARNSASSSLLAPSGSGSLEPVDAEGLGAGWSLQELLVVGMNRELTEECALRPGEIVSTEVVGYARWLERGAKPEFFGVTRLAVTSQELLRRQVSPVEELFVGGVHCIELDLAALATQLAAGASVLTAEACPPLVRERGSLPLLLSLRAAALAQAA
jgi:hypothetical protein